MDFVVLGFGIGAFVVLLGLAVRDLGPFARRIPRDGALAWSDVAARAAWGRACRAGGLVLALEGGVLCLLTGITLLVQVSDSGGMRAVLIGVTIAVLAIAVWIALYFWRPPFIARANFPSRVPTRAANDTSPDRSSSGRTGRSRDRRAESDPSDRSSRGRQRSNNRRPSESDAPRPDATRSGRGNNSDAIEGPRFGALTVDAMGGLRRAPISSPESDGPETNPESSNAPERRDPRRERNTQPDRTQRSGRDRRSG